MRPQQDQGLNCLPEADLKVKELLGFCCCNNAINHISRLSNDHRPIMSTSEDVAIMDSEPRGVSKDEIETNPEVGC